MKIQTIAIAGGIFVALAYAGALAQQPVITSFQGNGQLSWTNLTGTNGFAVQWAPAVTGPWSSNWDALDSLITSNAQTTVSVPMFYRVAQGFSLASMRGTWILAGTSRGNGYFIDQDDGISRECSFFIPRAPAGFFTVDVSGRVTNTFLFSGGGGITLPGTFASANLITLDPPYASAVLSRLDDASRCAGNWTGTLVSTNATSPDDGSSYPVSFSADRRGLVTNFTGFPNPGIGRMFALSNGPAIAFFTPGNNTDVDYDQICISGTLNGNTFTGSYYNDSSATWVGTASLTRQ
jgi:hypothetical protein